MKPVEFLSTEGFLRLCAIILNLDGDAVYTNAQNKTAVIMVVIVVNGILKHAHEKNNFAKAVALRLKRVPRLRQ